MTCSKSSVSAGDQQGFVPDASQRLADAIGRAREAHIQQRIATFFADPRWPGLKPHVERLLGVSLTPLDDLTRRVRLEVWRDFSGS